jgi:FkbM family methyltransferase
MDNLKLSVHHVGGRGGSRSFPVLNKFEKDIINVLYDADKECLDQVKKANKYLDSELYVFPYGLADKCKKAELNINYDPYTSSLLEYNSDFKSFYMFHNHHDYILGEALKTMEKQKIDLVTLDYLFNDLHISAPKPDFLSIDIEGGEYNLLKGAKGIMKSSVLAVYAEVAFLPFRKDQKGFSELCDLLSKQGFYFVSFANYHGNVWMQEMSPYRYPIGLRGKGFHTQSEALFLRKIDTLNTLFKDPLEQFLNLRKLAFISIVYNQIEYALECLKQSRMCIHDIETKQNLSKRFEYLNFLNALEAIEQDSKQILPQTFKTLFTFKQSKNRFISVKDKFYIKALIKIPGLKKIYSYLRSIITKINPKIKKIYFSLWSSSFEKIFKKYELQEQYKIIKKIRVDQQSSTQNIMFNKNSFYEERE